MIKPRDLDDARWKQLQAIAGAETPQDAARLDDPIAAGQLMLTGYIEPANGLCVQLATKGRRVTGAR